MPNKISVNSKALQGVIFAALVTVSGLASCGGGGGAGNPPPNTPAVLKPAIVSVTATPAIITSGSSAVITWLSVNSTSCFSSNSLGGAGISGSFATGSLIKNTTYTITCSGPTGPVSQSVMVAIAPTPPPTPPLTPTLAAILNKSNAWAITPVLQGTSYYYCDCGTGADKNCVAGSDTNTGTSNAPRKTIGDAITRYNSLTTSSPTTFAFCKGGAFNVTSRIFMNNMLCPPGTIGPNGITKTCTDFREYISPAFILSNASDAKPIINNMVGDNAYLFTFQQPNSGGVRFLNLKFQGDVASLTLNTEGIFTFNGAHDITVGNVTIDSFALPFNINSGGANAVLNPNIKVTGNTITNSSSMAYLGGGPNAEVSYNYFDGNGSTNQLDHTIYLSGGYVNIPNMNVVGNYIHGQYGSTCNGVVLTVHGQYTDLALSNNTIDIDPSAFSGGCYGLSVGDGGYPTAAIFQNVTISGNTINNGGNIAIGIAECSACVVNNNVITYNVNTSAVTTRPVGIMVPSSVSRLGDQINTGTTITNNTIWVGSNAIGGVSGIQFKSEGTGYVVANNTVNYASTNPGLIWGVPTCFDYPLPLASYTFINNNHCNFAATPYTWEATSGKSLTAWQTYSVSKGFDSASVSAPAQFVNSTTSPYDFHPTGSPLLGTGSPVYAPTTATDITGTPWRTLPAIGAYE